MPLVSFVVPVYNAEKTLERCVKSLQEQTVTDIEIVLVDDGSKDESLAVCQSLAKTDSRIRVMHQENAGVSVARNVGIENAQGQYISFVDADDWIDSNVCEVFSVALKQNDYDLFCFAADYHLGRKHTYTKVFAKDIALLSASQRDEFHLKIMTPWAPGFEYNSNTRIAGISCAKFYRTSVLKSLNPCFAPGIKISEDTLFLILNFECFKNIGCTRKIYYHYEQSDQSAQNRYRPDSYEQFSSIVKIVKRWLNSSQKGGRFKNSANTLFVHYLFGILKEDLFHKNNPCGTHSNIKKLRGILNKSVFADALNNVQWNYFTFAEKVLVFMLKLKMTRTIALAMKFVA